MEGCCGGGGEEGGAEEEEEVGEEGAFGMHGGGGFDCRRCGDWNFGWKE